MAQVHGVAHQAVMAIMRVGAMIAKLGKPKKQSATWQPKKEKKFVSD
jgi:hypothetical protein